MWPSRGHCFMLWDIDGWHPSDEQLERYCHGDQTCVNQIEAQRFSLWKCARKVTELIRAEVDDRGIGIYRVWLTFSSHDLAHTAGPECEWSVGQCSFVRKPSFRSSVVSGRRPAFVRGDDTFADLQVALNDLHQAKNSFTGDL